MNANKTDDNVLIQKRGTKILFPYTEALEAKEDMVVITVREAREQGLLSRPQRHTTEKVANVAELSMIRELKAENTQLKQKLNEQAAENKLQVLAELDMVESEEVEKVLDIPIAADAVDVDQSKTVDDVDDILMELASSP